MSEGMAEHTDPAPDTVDGSERYTGAEVDARINAAATPTNLIRAGEAIDWMRAQRDEARAQVATLTAERDKAARERDSLARRCAVRYEETEKLRAELAERTRERDTLGREGDRLARSLAEHIGIVAGLRRQKADLVEQVVELEAERDATRPVVEAAEVRAQVIRDGYEYGSGASGWSQRDRDSDDAIVAAVERYQHPAVTVSPDATDPDCGCPTGAGHTCGRMDEPAKGGLLPEGFRFFDDLGVASHAPTSPPSTSVPAEQPETEWQPGDPVHAPEARWWRCSTCGAGVLNSGGEVVPLACGYDGCNGTNEPIPGWEPIVEPRQGTDAVQGRTGALEAAIDAATRGYHTWGKLLPSPEAMERAVRAAAPHIQREALLGAADEAARSDWSWLRIDAAHWLRARASALIPAGSQDETGGGNG